MNEGILDRAARLKREAEARVASEISGLKVQRTVLALAFLTAGAYAGYLYVEGAKKVDAVAQASVVARNAEASKAESTKESAELRDKLAAMERTLNDERSKSSAFEAEIATLRADRTALQSKVDELVAAAAASVAKPTEIVNEAAPVRTSVVAAPMASESKSTGYVSKLTKDEAAKLAREFQSLSTTVSNAAARSTSIPTENARRCVARALELYQANKADIDAVAASRGMKIPDMTQAMSWGKDTSWHTRGGTWREENRASLRAGGDTIRSRQTNDDQHIQARRRFLSTWAPFVKALADATAGAAK